MQSMRTENDHFNSVSETEPKSKIWGPAVLNVLG